MGAAPTWPAWNNPPIVLYHGTLAADAVKIARAGVDISLGRPNTDFGRGFYTTTSMSQARKWAEHVGTAEGKPVAVVVLTVDRLALRRLRSLAFVRGTTDATDYWSFVAHSRRRRQASPATGRDYDVVYGPVARFWARTDSAEIYPDYDQVSFHGLAGQKLLRDRKHCSVEVSR